MADKVKPKKKFDLYHLVMKIALLFVLLFVLDMLDGEPDGLRGLAEFVRLVTGV